MSSVADTLRFEPAALPPELDELRAEVRAFLDETLADVPVVKRSHSWEAYDAEFSARLGEQGWIGMTLPPDYGGHGRSAFERYVVVEECLVAGAPTGFHWVADRQSGPLLVRYATEAQKKTIADFEYEVGPGLIAGQKAIPVNAAGCYAPGGRYADLTPLTGRGTLETHWRALRSYAEVTSLDGEPSLLDRLAVRWLRFTRPRIVDNRRQPIAAATTALQILGGGVAIAVAAVLLGLR